MSEQKCKCGRDLLYPGDSDPWCSGCNMSASVCDCVPLAPQPTPTPDGLLRRLDEAAAPSSTRGQSVVALCADAAARIRKLEAALQPFAAMARDNDDPNEVACERGTASDLTMITSKDFSAAAAALAAAAAEGGVGR